MFALTSLNPALVHDSGSCSMSAPRTVKRTRGPVCLRGRDATRLTWRNKSPADRHTPLDDWGEEGLGLCGLREAHLAFLSLWWVLWLCLSLMVGVHPGRFSGWLRVPPPFAKRKTTDSPMDGQPNGRTAQWTQVVSL